MKEHIAAILELSGQAEAFRPAIAQTIKALSSYGDEIRPVADSIIDYIADKKAKTVKRLEEQHGFSREEAILLTVDINTAIFQRLNSMSSKSKS